MVAELSEISNAINNSNMKTMPGRVKRINFVKLFKEKSSIV